MTFSTPNVPAVGLLAGRAAAELKCRFVQVSNAIGYGFVALRPSNAQFVNYAEFAPATPAPQLRGVAWTGNLLIGVFVLGFGIWSVVAPLKSAAIASGIVEPESSRKTIQHLEGGIVRQILVKNGDMVSSGQVLIRLDDIKPRTESNSLSGQFWDAKARQARLLSEQAGKDHIVLSDEIQAAAGTHPEIPAILSGQQKIFETRRDVARSQIVVIQMKMRQIQQEIIGLQAQQVALSTRADIVHKEIDTITALVSKKLERQSRLLDLMRENADINGQLGETAAQIARAEQAISEAQADLLKFESDRQNEIAQSLRETESQLLQLAERMQAVDDQLSRTEIRAPQDGVVTDLRIHTAGGVVGAGEPLLDLVPKEDRLIVTARIRPEDINVVHIGLPTKLYLLPYDQRRVPLLSGTVVYVSADRLVDKQSGQSYYAATIRVSDEQLATMKDVKLVPGMPVQALIETGQSTVALYALRPVLDSFSRAFRED
jgi:HlyD family secretion protein